MHDLLSDPLIGVRTSDGYVGKVSLPGAISGLLCGSIDDFTGLRAHQADAWHVLLVQLAASVMARHSQRVDPPTDEAFWRGSLLDLADGHASAWHLVVDDVGLPAFMQHPLKDAHGANAFSRMFRHPDQLDVLITAKNHDVKAERARSDDVELWLYAVVMLQTVSGYSGARNYGSIRMNSGTGSRCVVSLVSDTSVAARFREELAVVRTMRARLLTGSLPYQSRGVVLTWLTPWCRQGHQWILSDLEPLFVEAVRPLRLKMCDGHIRALASTSDARQIGPRTIENGDIGDPWLPINEADKKKGRSALTVGASGWSPALLSDLLLQQSFELTELQQPRAAMQRHAWFIASVLVRGQGTTDGLRRVAMPVPAQALPLLARPATRAQLGQAAAKLRDDAAEVQKSLFAALMSLASGGPESVKQDSKVLAAWAAVCVEPFTRSWSERYFEALWRLASEPLADVRAAWQVQLVEHARRTLRAAEARVPTPGGRRWRGRVNAKAQFYGSLRKKGLVPDASNEPAAEVSA